jgi:hypothetical protein
MRFSISKRILPGVRIGASFGGGRPVRIRATERLGRGLYVTESKSLGRRKKRR